VQFDTTEEAQEATLQHAVALRLEVGVHHAHAIVVRQVTYLFVIEPRSKYHDSRDL
jgi:hypothetical protein